MLLAWCSWHSSSSRQLPLAAADSQACEARGSCTHSNLRRISVSSSTSAAIPLDLQAYQAGFGVKIGWEDLHLRGLLDLVASGASDSFAVKIGATAEYHLTPEPVSFYVGGSGGGGYMNQSGSFASVVFSVGAIAGVEYFPLKFLSVFVGVRPHRRLHLDHRPLDFPDHLRLPHRHEDGQRLEDRDRHLLPAAHGKEIGRRVPIG